MGGEQARERHRRAAAAKESCSSAASDKRKEGRPEKNINTFGGAVCSEQQVKGSEEE